MFGRKIALSVLIYLCFSAWRFRDVIRPGRSIDMQKFDSQTTAPRFGSTRSSCFFCRRQRLSWHFSSSAAELKGVKLKVGRGALSVVTFAHFLRQLVSHLVRDKSKGWRRGAGAEAPPSSFSGGWMGRVGAPLSEVAAVFRARAPHEQRRGHPRKNFFFSVSFL